MPLGEWTLQGQEVSCSWDQKEGVVKVRLYPASSNSNSPMPLLLNAPPELSPSRICVYEWCDYRMRVEGAPGDPRAEIDGVPLPVDRDHFFTLRYENQLGRSCIRFRIPGKPPIALPLEVLSPRKYPHPLVYARFYRRLLDDLSRAAVQLPFTFSGLTHMTVREHQALASELFAYHFLRSQAKALRSALDRIVADPHRRLSWEGAWRPLAEASHLDSEVLTQLFAHADRWVPAPRSSFALARRLGGQAPEELWQPISQDTYDTPENRFVVAFVRMLQLHLHRIKQAVWWEGVHRASQETLRGLAATLQQVAILPLFAEVGEMRAHPVASKVLQLRDGYRELAHLWRQFHVARAPFFAALEEAIALREVATLYEFWCFYRLIEDLSRHFDARPRCVIAVGDLQGLKYEASARWAGHATLVYNRTQRPPDSYSLAMRPDFILLKDDGGPPVLFDAKFRFDRENWELEEVSGSHRATRDDLYAMHTYRDALNAHAAIVLYPGNRALAFDAVRRTPKEDIRLADVLALQGIGALPLEPGQET